MKDWQGHPIRHLFCYNGEGPHEAYDCACCMTWSPPPDCGCICHERIEKMARTGDIQLLFSALVSNGTMPKFPSCYQELMDWQQENLDAGRTHYHNTNGKFVNYPKVVCSTCIPSLEPHPSILYDTHTGILLQIPGTPEPSCQKCGSPRPPLRNLILIGIGMGDGNTRCDDPWHGPMKAPEPETDGCKFHTAPEPGWTPGRCEP